MTDNELVKKVQEKACDRSILKLIERHKPLTIKIYHKFAFLLSKRNYFSNDFHGDISMIFVRAINSFDPDKGSKFSSWLANHTRYFCLNLLNKTEHFVSWDEAPKTEEVDEREFTETLDFSLGILSQLKDKRIKRIFEMRYLNPPPSNEWKAISKVMGLSAPAVAHLHSLGISLLRAKLKSNVICDET